MWWTQNDIWCRQQQSLLFYLEVLIWWTMMGISPTATWDTNTFFLQCMKLCKADNIYSILKSWFCGLREGHCHPPLGTLSEFLYVAWYKAKTANLFVGPHVADCESDLTIPQLGTRYIFHMWNDAMQRQDKISICGMMLYKGRLALCAMCRWWWMCCVYIRLF